MKKTYLIKAKRRLDEILNETFLFEDSSFQPKLENPNNNDKPYLIEIIDHRSRFIKGLTPIHLIIQFVVKVQN